VDLGCAAFSSLLPQLFCYAARESTVFVTGGTGQNTFGQVGNGRRIHQREPTLIIRGGKIRSIAVGAQSTAVVLE
jgi:hypothetical protein